MAIQLTYYQKLYTGYGIPAEKLDKLKKKLEKHPALANVYLITNARNGIDQLEIYHSGLLEQRYYQKNPPYIIGIVKTYAEAVAVIEQIVKECLDVRGDCALREYLLC